VAHAPSVPRPDSSGRLRTDRRCAGHPEESGCGTYEYVRHNVGPAGSVRRQPGGDFSMGGRQGRARLVGAQPPPGEVADIQRNPPDRMARPGQHDLAGIGTEAAPLDLRLLDDDVLLMTFRAGCESPSRAAGPSRWPPEPSGTCRSRPSPPLTASPRMPWCTRTKPPRPSGQAVQLSFSWDSPRGGLPGRPAIAMVDALRKSEDHASAELHLAAIDSRRFRDALPVVSVADGGYRSGKSKVVVHVVTFHPQLEVRALGDLETFG